MKATIQKLLNPFTIGTLLLLLYLIQYFFELQWKWLYDWQVEEMYKRWSGLILALFLAFQWTLTLTRVVKKWRKYSFKFTRIHQWIGAFSPILLYAHSMKFGYAYLLAFSIMFLLNMLLGTVNLDVLKSKKEWVFQSWMIAHVALSVLITFVMFFHIGMVFYYQ